MKNYHICIVINCFIFFLIQNTIAQENKEYSVTLDSIIGKENLIIANGLLHYNDYKINDKKNIYYNNELYTYGSIEYLNQKYYNLKLKYDVYNDNLIFKPAGEAENSGIILHKEKVSEFHIYNKKFININYNKNIESEETGFFEVNLSKSEFIFLTKHTKSKKDLIIQNSLKYEFTDNETFFILKDNKLIEIKSKSTLIKIFPEKNKIIKTYFKNNIEIKKANKSLFYLSLFNQF